MPIRRLVLLVVLLLLATACSGGEDENPRPRPSPSASASSAQPTSDCAGEPGTSTQELTVDGEDRSYLVQTPSGWDGSEPLPVVYVIHGLGGQADTTLAYTRMAEVGQEHDFLVVAPQAEGARPQWDFRTPASEDGSDAAFLSALVDEVAERWCVDEDRQFATGISNGSAVVLALACSGDFPFRAYGGVAAAFYDETVCGDAPPTSIVYFHGTDDEIVPFDGGPTPIEPAPPVEESLAAWAGHSGCAATPSVADVADDVERRTWRSCDSGARLEAYYVDGGGHTWPGASPIPPLGPTTTSIDASEVMAEFFGLVT